MACLHAADDVIAIYFKPWDVSCVFLRLNKFMFRFCIFTLCSRKMMYSINGVWSSVYIFVRRLWMHQRCDQPASETSNTVKASVEDRSDPPLPKHPQSCTIWACMALADTTSQRHLVVQLGMGQFHAPAQTWMGKSMPLLWRLLHFLFSLLSAALLPLKPIVTFLHLSPLENMKDGRKREIIRVLSDSLLYNHWAIEGVFKIHTKQKLCEQLAA